MDAISELVILDSRYEVAARCLVCGNEIAAGEGVTARYGDRRLRFKCPGCLIRFETDPQRYLAAHAVGCCRDAECESPASEWTCD